MTYPFERYLNIRTAMGPTFRPDGRRLAFLTNITGTNQIWAVDIPAAGAPTPWPDQLTFFKERVNGVSYSPVNDELVFSTDIGGNEHDQLFLLSGDGQSMRQLTDNLEAIHRFDGWSHDGTRIAFSSNARENSVFDVYVMDVRTGQTELVYEGDGWCYGGGFSPDDSKMLIGQAYSNFEQQLWLMDLGSGRLHSLTTPDKPARYGAAFAPDGR
ncbi:MAG: S9 family peptidase, partial [Anaerolineae bacterium]|nr:S9 family peptidase [Anaerolineae bacterium]